MCYIPSQSWLNKHTQWIMNWLCTRIVHCSVFCGHFSRSFFSISSLLYISFTVISLVIGSSCDWSNVIGAFTLQWRHNECDGGSNHQPHDSLPRRLFRCRSKKTSKPRVSGLCEENSPVTSKFPAQTASNAENVSIWWRHQVYERTAWIRKKIVIKLNTVEPHANIFLRICCIPEFDYCLRSTVRKLNEWAQYIYYARSHCIPLWTHERGGDSSLYIITQSYPASVIACCGIAETARHVMHLYKYHTHIVNDKISHNLKIHCI